MGEESSSKLGAFLATLRKNVLAALTVMITVATSATIVWHAGTDYQGLKSQVEANRAQIELLRAEQRAFESSVLFILGQPRKAQP